MFGQNRGTAPLKCIWHVLHFFLNHTMEYNHSVIKINIPPIHSCIIINTYLLRKTLVIMPSSMYMYILKCIFKHEFSFFEMHNLIYYKVCSNSDFFPFMSGTDKPVPFDPTPVLQQARGSTMFKAKYFWLYIGVVYLRYTMFVNWSYNLLEYIEVCCKFNLSSKLTAVCLCF
jgi:hypothetical protein